MDIVVMYDVYNCTQYFIFGKDVTNWIYLKKTSDKIVFNKPQNILSMSER